MRAIIRPGAAAILFRVLLPSVLVCLASVRAALAADFTWTWMNGTNRTGSSYLDPVYGEKGIPDPANTPGQRIDATAWTDSSGSLWLFGGAGGPHSNNDFWKYNPAIGEWAWMNGEERPGLGPFYGAQGVPDPYSNPGMRHSVAAHIDQTGAMWLFGGYEVGVFNDLWKCDPVSGIWTWIRGTDETAGSYGVRGTPDPANTPGARQKASMWVDRLGNVWLFGGFSFYAGYPPAIYNWNDLWKFNPGSGAWTWMSGSSVSNSAAVYGVQGTSSAADTPGARFGSTTWSDDSGNLWLFGGQYYEILPTHALTPVIYRYNDLWKYDVTAKQWTWMKGSVARDVAGAYGVQRVPAAANSPGARDRAAGWTDNAGAFWLVGGLGTDGLNNFGYLNDVWKYTPATGNWTWVGGSNERNQDGTYGVKGIPDSANIPGARYSAAAWFDPDADTAWLYGGVGYAGGALGNLGDLWRLTLPSSKIDAADPKMWMLYR